MHLIGKEIARFHTLIWPAMLWSAGLPAPTRIFAHGWVLTDGEKMSKSLGNVIDPFALAEQFGADSVRYFLFREAPFGSDFSISVEKLRLRHNADLGNDWGNLLNRTLTMLAKYRNGLVPAASESQLGERFADIGVVVHEHIMALRFREALEAIWELITALNREIEERKPWELHKHERGVELDALLYDLCEGLRFTSILLFPFMPAKAGEMWRQLGLTGTPDVRWSEALQWGALAANTQTAPGEKLFPRIEPALA
jgi:methionyl-tRNA synthetase